MCCNLCEAAKALVSQAAPGLVANARNHISEAIACRLAPHAPAKWPLQRRAGELVKVRALIRFPVDGNAVELRGTLGSEAVRNDFDRTPFKL